VIIFNNLSKQFGQHTALSDVNLHIPTGQMWGLLGPNGAGKTTLFRILMGILKASSGSAMIAGLDAFDARVEVKRVLGFLPDEPMFHSYLSGREIFDLTATLHGLDANTCYRRLQPLIDRMQMIEALGKFADDYSRGMKKKLGLLLAIVHQPKLLVLDEPTNGLDVESTALFYELMREQLSLGVTVIFSTHLLAQVEALCSHAAIIHRGKVVAHGALAQIAAAAPRPARAANSHLSDMPIDPPSLEQAFLAYTKAPELSPLEAMRARVIKAAQDKSRESDTANKSRESDTANKSRQ
jgi:ABC-2 type transport system ATP-binding protein